MIKFEKVSFEQFEKDYKDINKIPYDITTDSMFEDERNELRKKYDKIKLPTRATKGSAGYDFFAPYNVGVKKGEYTTIPTGIRIILPKDKVLNIYPRSGLGFKDGMRLANTVGIIDSDYSYSDNEGHIIIKVTCDIESENIYGRNFLAIDAGKAFVQGVITKYYTTDDDNVNNERNGGFGSTDSKG